MLCIIYIKVKQYLNATLCIKGNIMMHIISLDNLVYLSI